MIILKIAAIIGLIISAGYAGTGISEAECFAAASGDKVLLLCQSLTAATILIQSVYDDWS